MQSGIATGYPGKSCGEMSMDRQENQNTVSFQNDEKLLLKVLLCYGVVLALCRLFGEEMRLIAYMDWTIYRKPLIARVPYYLVPFIGLASLIWSRHRLRSLFFVAGASFVGVVDHGVAAFVSIWWRLPFFRLRVSDPIVRVDMLVATCLALVFTIATLYLFRLSKRLYKQMKAESNQFIIPVLLLLFCYISPFVNYGNIIDKTIATLRPLKSAKLYSVGSMIQYIPPPLDGNLLALAADKGFSMWNVEERNLEKERIGKNNSEVSALSPLIEWEKSYGGSNSEKAYSIQQTSDGGYIVGGNTNSRNGAVSGNHGQYAGWVIKLDTKGKSVWRKTFNNSGRDYIDFVAETADGGYIAAGFSALPISLKSSSNSQCLLIKLSKDGDLIWQKTYGKSGLNRITCIQQTSDGNYIFSGMFTVSNEQGSVLYQVVKLDPNGDIVWQKSTGGCSDEGASSIRQTADGGYIVAAGSRFNSHGDYDYWVVKLNLNGEIEWQKSLGGSKKEWAESIQLTRDGGYIVAGASISNDGDVSSNHGGKDYWIVKLNHAGELIWQRSFGGSRDDEARSIQQTADGGYIVAGSSKSNDGDVSSNHGSSDAWIIKLNSEGELIWQRSLGGSQGDGAYSVQQTTDEGYIIAGVTTTFDVDVSFHFGKSDYWIVKLLKDVVD
jgi:hypothetical protein